MFETVPKRAGTTFWNPRPTAQFSSRSRSEALKPDDVFQQTTKKKSTMPRTPVHFHLADEEEKGTQQPSSTRRSGGKARAPHITPPEDRKPAATTTSSSSASAAIRPPPAVRRTMERRSEEIKASVNSGRAVASIPSPPDVMDTAEEEQAKIEAKIAAHQDQQQNIHPGAVAVQGRRHIDLESGDTEIDGDFPAGFESQELGDVGSLDDDTQNKSGMTKATAIDAELVEAQAQRERQRVLDEAVRAEVIQETLSEKCYSWIRKRWLLAGGVLLVLVVIGVVVGVLVGKKDGKSSPTSPPPSTQTFAPTGPENLFLREQLEEEFGEILPGTPQAEALAWLANDDPLQLPEDTPFQTLKERYALATLYFSTNGERWTEKYGFLNGSSVCNWNDGKGRVFGSGVFCDDSASSVVEIFMLKNNLAGSIPSEVAALGSLEVFALGENFLTGSIPALTSPNLRNLVLYQNRLSGPIPPLAAYTSLDQLLLYENFLNGTIPAITSPNLTDVVLYQNMLSGQIPSFATSTSLTYFLLFDNKMEGKLEEILSDLHAPGLLAIGIGTNNITGTIPSSIQLFTDLVGFAVDESGLTGTLPTELGLLTNLTDALALYENKLSGLIPSELGLLTDLELLDLDENGLSSTIPSEIGLMGDLINLFLAFNELTGAVPTEIAALPKLEALNLAGNDFDGSLDPFFCERAKPFEDFLAGCLGPNPDINCTCCTHCCGDTPESCVKV